MYGYIILQYNIGMIYYYSVCMYVCVYIYIYIHIYIYMYIYTYEGVPGAPDPGSFVCYFFIVHVFRV